MTTGPSKAHYELTNVGLRAQATAAGLVQLCKELHRAGALQADAIDRIKGVVADEIALSAPKSTNRLQFRKEVCERLDRIFAGDRAVGDASDIAFRSDD